MLFVRLVKVDARLTMLVHNVYNTEKKEGVKKSRKRDASGNFEVFLKDEDETSADSISSITPTIGINSLFSLQEIPTQEKLQKENYNKGDETLQQLDKYSSALLNGEDMSLSGISKSLESRTRSDDKHLEDILDSISLRAAVEAAKKESA